MWATAPSCDRNDSHGGRIVSSVTYNAPPQVVTNSQATVTLRTRAGTDTVSTTVFLTPITVQIIPATVQLETIQAQQFTAIVAGDPIYKVNGNLSPKSVLTIT